MPFYLQKYFCKSLEENLESLTEQQKREEPTPQLLRLIAPCVLNPEEFGVQLGYKRRQVISKFLQDTTESKEIQALNILEAWGRKTKTKPTIGRLMQALQDSGVPEQSYKSVILDFFSEKAGGQTETDWQHIGDEKVKNLFQMIWSRLKRKK